MESKYVYEKPADEKLYEEMRRKSLEGESVKRTGKRYKWNKKKFVRNMAVLIAVTVGVTLAGNHVADKMSKSIQENALYDFSFPQNAFPEVLREFPYHKHNQMHPCKESSRIPRGNDCQASLPALLSHSKERIPLPFPGVQEALTPFLHRCPRPETNKIFSGPRIHRKPSYNCPMRRFFRCISPTR